jgi:glutathione S-transferase
LGSGQSVAAVIIWFDGSFLYRRVMILIGQYDSPFVRRVAIAMNLHGITYEHRPWSTFGDAEKLGEVNPLRRVPTLVCDDGVALMESHLILDHLDGLVGPDRALFPASGAARRDALRICALACGMADKAVSLFYEMKLHDMASDLWMDRCRTQIGGTLRLLEAERAAQTSPFWGGDAIGHADIATACILRFVSQAHPGVIDAKMIPALAALADRCEAMDIFQKISQPFVPPS